MAVFPGVYVLAVHVGQSISCCLNFAVYLRPSVFSFLDTAVCLSIHIWLSLSDCYACLSNSRCQFIAGWLWIFVYISSCLRLAVPFCCTVLVCHCQLSLAVCFWSPIWFGCPCLVVFVWLLYLLSLSGCLSVVSMFDCPCLALFVYVWLTNDHVLNFINIDNHTHT
jgi:hypothetical protein